MVQKHRVTSFMAIFWPVGRRVWPCLIAGLCLSPLSWAATPEVITYLTEDYPPENYLDQGVLKGYAVDTLRLLWQHMGVTEQPIKVLPWARAYAMVQANPNHMLFAMARTPERENLFKWVGPIYVARCALFALPGNRNGLTNLGDAKRFKIGVLRKDIGDVLLRDSGFPDSALLPISTLKQMVQMLQGGRLDFICTTEPSMRKEWPAPPGAWVKAMDVADFKVFYAFNPQTEDALIERFNRALDSMDRERREIVKKYYVSE